MKKISLSKKGIIESLKLLYKDSNNSKTNLNNRYASKSTMLNYMYNEDIKTEGETY